MLGDFTTGVLGFPGADTPENKLYYARIWGTSFTIVAVTLTWLQTYGFLEKV